MVIYFEERLVIMMIVVIIVRDCDVCIYEVTFLFYSTCSSLLAILEVNRDQIIMHTFLTKLHTFNHPV